MINNSTSDVIINDTSSGDTITNSARSVTINAGKGNDVINLERSCRTRRDLQRSAHRKSLRVHHRAQRHLSDTSIGDARKVMAHILSDINDKIRSISLMPVDTTTTPLDLSKIYLDLTATDTGAVFSSADGKSAAKSTARHSTSASRMMTM